MDGLRYAAKDPPRVHEKEGSEVSHRTRSAALGTLVLVVAACGGTSSGTPAAAATTPAAAATAAPSATVAAVSTATTGPAAGTCPTAATVNAALGVSLSAPVGVPGGGGTQLPAGSVGLVCEYHGATANVIIEVITNTDPSLISKFSDKFPVPYTAVSGVGDQARSFRQQLGGGKDNEAVVATNGSTLVEVTATATPATLKQVEALVSQLL